MRCLETGLESAITGCDPLNTIQVDVHVNAQLCMAGRDGPSNNYNCHNIY